MWIYHNHPQFFSLNTWSSFLSHHSVISYSCTPPAIHISYPSITSLLTHPTQDKMDLRWIRVLFSAFQKASVSNLFEGDTLLGDYACYAAVTYPTLSQNPPPYIVHHYLLLPLSSSSTLSTRLLLPLSMPLHLHYLLPSTLQPRSQPPKTDDSTPK
jgi:hypothetical protein